jgi:hypothetical protein
MEKESKMLYETRTKWLLPMLLLAAWLVAGCVTMLRPTAPVTAPAADAAPDVDLGADDAQTQAAAEAVRALLAARLHLAADAVTVVAAEPVVWPDACLGAPGPEEMCAQVLTPGHKITLAAAGQHYTFHTDAGAYWLRLVDGPAVDVGEPVIRWQGAVDNGSCQEAVIGAGGVAFAGCGGAPFPGKFVSPARAAALNEFAARYASFSAATDWGEISFNGVGPQAATPVEQTQLASWAQRLVMEAASGAALSGMAWSGPQEMGSGDTSKCATLQMSGGEATVWDCAGNFETVKLNGGHLTRWLEIQDRFAAFVVETPTETLSFDGMGAEAGAVWQQALLAWARTQYAELRSGQTSAAGSTVLAWDIGPANDLETGCMHLTVLAWGEAYAELRDCTAGGAVQDVATGWLTTAEMEQLAAWMTDAAPLYAEQGYVASASTSSADESPVADESPALADVEAWAANVWLRLRGVSTAQEAAPASTGSAGEAGGGGADSCPTPAGAAQLLVNVDDGYCLLYPAGYVAEQTAPGATSIVLGSLMNHTDPRVSIEVSDAQGRTLAEIGDQLVADYAAGFDVVRATATVDGAEALVLDNLPGQDLNRRVAVLHNDRLYSFFFTPLGETEEARAALDAFYQGVLGSFWFLDEASG